MNILLILKGILIGIGKIIPGVSGSVMAISLGIYDRAIMCVTHFFDDVINNLKYLLCLGIGIVLGIVFFSKVILYFLDNYYFYTMIMLIGLIIGGSRTIYKNCDRNMCGYFIMMLGFLFMGIFTFIGGSSRYVIRNNFFDNIVYFLSGMLEGFGTIIPGISSTALLMIVGIYDIFIYNISNLFDMSFVISNIFFYVFFGIGLFISIFGCIYIIQMLFLKYRSKTFSFILGIVISNILFLFVRIISYITIKNLIIGIILLGIGLFISFLFDE